MHTVREKLPASDRAGIPEQVPRILVVVRRAKKHSYRVSNSTAKATMER